MFAPKKVAVTVSLVEVSARKERRAVVQELIPK